MEKRLSKSPYRRNRSKDRDHRDEIKSSKSIDRRYPHSRSSRSRSPKSFDRHSDERDRKQDRVEAKSIDIDESQPERGSQPIDPNNTIDESHKSEVDDVQDESICYVFGVPSDFNADELEGHLLKMDVQKPIAIDKISKSKTNSFIVIYR